MADRPTRYEVLLTQGAEQDLESIHDYIAEFDCVENADRVLDRLMKVVEGLTKLGIKEYRETSFKPYRVIYRVLANQVVIALIVDGRRDMESVLARRLLGA